MPLSPSLGHSWSSTHTLHLNAASECTKHSPFEFNSQSRLLKTDLISERGRAPRHEIGHWFTVSPHFELTKLAFRTSDAGWILDSNSMLCLIKSDRANQMLKDYSHSPIKNYWNTSATTTLKCTQFNRAVYCLNRDLKFLILVLFCEHIEDYIKATDVTVRSYIYPQ